MADELLRYSDLIAADNSIDDLIGLLDKVQDEYVAIAQLSRQYAADLARDMRKVNTNTKAGQDALARLTQQADMLNSVIESLEIGYNRIGDEIASLQDKTAPATHNIAALVASVQKYKEVAMGMRTIREMFEPDVIFGTVDKSFLQDMLDLEDVVNSAGPGITKYVKGIQEAIIEQLRLQEAMDVNAEVQAATQAYQALSNTLEILKGQYKGFTPEEKASELGKVTLHNIDVLRKAVTAVDAVLEPFIEGSTELIKAQQGLAAATSAEGKAAVATKQDIAELNKVTSLQAIIAKEASDSQRALEAQLELTWMEWKKLPEGMQNSAQGQALQDRIKSLTTILGEMRAKLKLAKAELTAAEQATKNLERANRDLEVAMTAEGQAAAVTRQRISELNKETRLRNKEVEAEAGSEDELKAQIALTQMELSKLAKAKRLTTQEGQALEARLVTLRTELKMLQDRTKATTTSMTQAQVQTKQATTITEKLAQAKAKVALATSKEYVELLSYSDALREANRLAKLDAIIKTSKEGSYNRLAAEYEKAKIRLKAMSREQRENTEEGQKLTAQLFNMRKEMQRIQEMTGVHTLSVGEYGKVWDNLGFSVVQVVRELPSAAFGINTLMQAVSNNIPILIDNIQQVRKENAALIREGRQDEVVDIGKRIAQSLFSWQTALIALLTALSMFSDDIIEWVKSLSRAKGAAISMKEAIRNLNKELENSNDSYGDNMATLKKLQNQWNSLRSEAEQAEWLKNHKEAFEDLGEAAETVADVERILVEQADAVEETFRRRAEAAAATALATKEYEDALVASAKVEHIIRKQAEKRAKNENKANARYNKAAGANYLTTDYTAEDFYDEVASAKIEKGIFNRIRRLYNKAQSAIATGDQYIEMASVHDDIADDPDKNSDPEGRDLTDRIYQARLQAAKKYAESETELIKNEYDKREAEAKASADAEIKTLEEANRKAMDWLQDNGVKYKVLTDEQRQALNDTIIKNNAAILNEEEKLAEELRLIAIDEQIGVLQVQENTNALKLQAVKEGSVEEYDLRKESIERQKQMELLENSKLEKSVQQEEADIIAKYNKMLEDLADERNITLAEKAIEGIELQLQAVREGSAEELELQKELLDKQLALELEKNRMLDASLQQEEADIKASYGRRKKLLEGEYTLEAFTQGQATSRAQYIADDKAGDKGIKGKQLNDYYLGIYDLEQEMALLNKQISLAKQGFLDWSPEQIAAAEAEVVTLNKKLDEAKDIVKLIADEGLGKGILTALGFKDDRIDALQSAASIVIDQIGAIMDAEVEAAEKAVELAQERVDAFQSAYDAEIEARNNGYANSVATAKKELEQEKKNQREKQKLLEQAQKKQEAINSITQASSLITASAQLWEAFSPLGALGIAGAIAGIATMWASFTAAKIKAKSITSQEYGEGGLEFLSGGSHASGNDIDLGTTNSRGRRMRAEGGEAMAIINKRNTRKYRKMLPEIVDSLNKGFFEDKYLNSLSAGSVALTTEYRMGADLTKIEDGVEDIRRQGETRYYSQGGYLVIQHKNVKRIIKN